MVSSTYTIHIWYSRASTCLICGRTYDQDKPQEIDSMEFLLLFSPYQMCFPAFLKYQNHLFLFSLFLLKEYFLASDLYVKYILSECDLLPWLINKTNLKFIVLKILFHFLHLLFFSTSHHFQHIQLWYTNAFYKQKTHNTWLYASD